MMTKTDRIADRLVRQIHDETPFKDGYTIEAARRVLRRELKKLKIQEK